MNRNKYGIKNRKREHFMFSFFVGVRANEFAGYL